MIIVLYFTEMIIGICFLCAGAVLGIIANIGQTSSTALCCVISNISGVSIGFSMIILYSLFVLFQFIMLGIEFKAIRLMQLIPTLLHGFFLNFFKCSFTPFKHIVVSAYWERLILFICALFLISTGFAVLKCSNFISYPPESFCYEVAKRLHIRFGSCKIMLDAAYVLLALLLTAVFGLDFGVIREGTMIFVLCDGVIINQITPPLSKLFRSMSAFASPKPINYK